MTTPQSPASPPARMQAIRVHRHGPPEVMALEETTVPVPGPQEVLVRVHVAGVNYADLGQRSGSMGMGPPPGSSDQAPAGPPASGSPPGMVAGPPPGAFSGPPPGSPPAPGAERPGPPPTQAGPHAVTLPYTPGFEVVGKVLALGAGVRGFVIGQRVAAVLEEGGYAPYAVAPAEKTYAVPEALGDAEATLMLVQGLTAYGLLHDAAQIQPGEWVLVEGAAGGVGSLAVQLAKLAGARVVGAVGSAAKLAHIESFGLDLCVNYSEPGWERRVLEETGGVQVILESVGGSVGMAALETAAKFARVVMFGGASGQMLPFPVLIMGMMTRGLKIMGFNPWLRPDTAPHNAQAVADAVLSGAVKPWLEHFSLEQASEAHRAIAERRVTGKVVLDIG